MFKNLLKFASVAVDGSIININGRNYKGKSVRIENNKVIVDDKVVDSIEEYVINVKIIGDVDTLNLTSGDIEVSGNVNNLNLKSGDVKISGDVKSLDVESGDVTCNNLHGSINITSGNIICNTIKQK